MVLSPGSNIFMNRRKRILAKKLYIVKIQQGKTWIKVKSTTNKAEANRRAEELDGIVVVQKIITDKRPK